MMANINCIIAQEVIKVYILFFKVNCREKLRRMIVVFANGSNVRTSLNISLFEHVRIFHFGLQNNRIKHN